MMFAAYCLLVTHAVYLVMGTLSVLYPWAVVIKPMDEEF